MEHVQSYLNKNKVSVLKIYKTSKRKQTSNPSVDSATISYHSHTHTHSNEKKTHENIVEQLETEHSRNLSLNRVKAILSSEIRRNFESNHTKQNRAIVEIYPPFPLIINYI